MTLFKHINPIDHPIGSISEICSRFALYSSSLHLAELDNISDLLRVVNYIRGSIY